jgi:hypothetical protein
LARLCDVLGYSAITEHQKTNADVYVTEAEVVIEVQRWSTKFEQRTRRRQREGQSVLWLLTEDAAGSKVKKALFTLPAARLRVHARGNRRQTLEPWEHPEQNSDAVLSVYATVARLKFDNHDLGHRASDAARFLKEVLSGQRRWYPPRTPGLPIPYCGAWVLTKDLERVLDARSSRRASLTAGIVDSDAYTADEGSDPDAEPGVTRSVKGNQPEQAVAEAPEAVVSEALPNSDALPEPVLPAAFESDDELVPEASSSEISPSSDGSEPEATRIGLSGHGPRPPWWSRLAAWFRERP